MKLIPSCELGQPFGANYNGSYAASGLLGHTGVDDACGFGSPIYFPYASGYVYKVLTVDNPSNDGTGFTGVFVTVDDGIESFEYLVGHCNPVVQEGQTVAQGDLIGLEANHGLVYSGNMQITIDMQKAGDQRGHHRHEQKRPFLKVLRADLTFNRFLDKLSDNPPGTIYRDNDGFYYEVWDYQNGYHGCIDPTTTVFGRSLTLGSEGYDVFVLQRILVREGLATFDPTGFFGLKTAAALRQFQQKNGLSPSLGTNCGPATRALLGKKYRV